jgi:phosphoribosyl 1,2-cyclic phosphodiesterase
MNCLVRSNVKKMSNIKPSPPQINLDPEQNTGQHEGVEEFVIQFWGVRGLIPTPSCETSRYGGNTACTEIQVAGKSLIFDGGTGLRILGRSYLESPNPLKAHLFFTNSQSNRIQGFPFFAPAFVPENSFHIYGSAASNGASIKQSLCDQMLQPHFPYPLQVMQSELHFHNLVPGMVVTLDDVVVSTALINQTQRSVGFRVSWKEYSVAYVTDLQLNSDESDQERIAELTNGVDLLIANATYIPPTVNNNHKSNLLWQPAVDLADSVSAKRLVISCHHPDDQDEFLESMEIDIQSTFPKGVLAKEGMSLTVI